MRITEVALRWVVRVGVRVWWRGESAGMVTVSSPTMEKSAALACRRQLASVELVRSTWIVALAVVAEVISNPSSRDVTGGVDCTNAAHTSQVSPTSTSTASTPITNRRRPGPFLPYRASRSVVPVPPESDGPVSPESDGPVSHESDDPAEPQAAPDPSVDSDAASPDELPSGVGADAAGPVGAGPQSAAAGAGVGVCVCSVRGDWSWDRSAEGTAAGVESGSGAGVDDGSAASAGVRSAGVVDAVSAGSPGAGVDGGAAGVGSGVGVRSVNGGPGVGGGVGRPGGAGLEDHCVL